MRRHSCLLIPALTLAASCGRGETKAGDMSTADSTPALAVSATPGAIVTVLYNTPKSTAAFEKYYKEPHLPLVVANQKEIGFERADLTKFESALDGKKPAFHRQAELY